MFNSVSDAVKVKVEKELTESLEVFEDGLRDIFKELREKLAQRVLTSEVPQIELHMTTVESYRDRTARYLSIAAALVEVAKSNRFLLASGKGVNQIEKESYQKGLAAGYVALKLDLEELIRSIDSRVNLCKKLLGLSDDLNTGLRR